jgi:hypothetical protein
MEKCPNIIEKVTKINIIRGNHIFIQRIKLFT